MSARNDTDFLRMFALVLGGLVAFTVVIMFVAGQLSTGVEERIANDPSRKATVAERIAPVGKVIKEGETPPAVEPKLAAAPAAGGGDGAGDGKATYEAACAACHMAGVAGAPKLGDQAAWADRIAQGEDVLNEHAVKGFQGSQGVMPPKGGRADLSDDAVKAAVAYMVGESGGEKPAAATAAEKVTETVAKATETVAETATKAAEAVSETAAAVVDKAADTAQAAAGAKPAAAGADGEATYKAACAVCHQMGIAGAPKLGDKAGWVDRIAQGRDLLVEHAVKGFQGTVGVMPPKGGRPDLSDEDVAAAVDYMVSQSQ